METDCAVMPSTESTGRSTTESGAAVPTGISTTGNCQTFCRSRFRGESRRTMASARRRRSRRSGGQRAGADLHFSQRPLARHARDYTVNAARSG